MNREAVARRIDLVGTSTGSIVGVATWCALHAQDADVVIPYITERVQSANTLDSHRASLLFVLHELLLTCASHGVPESAKGAVLIQVSRSLPPAVEAVLRLPSKANAGFVDALGKVLGWWELLRLFPTTWLDGLRRRLREAQDGQTEVPMLAALQRITHLMSRYHDTKAHWEGSKQTGAGQAVDAAVDDAVRGALAAVQKAVDRLGDSGKLRDWCEAQRVELEGRSPPKQDDDAPPLTAVKTEVVSVNHPAPLPDDDDILGSFY